MIRRRFFPPLTLSPDQLGRARLHLAWLMLIINILAILFCGWFPFNFGEQLGNYVFEFNRRFHWDIDSPPDVLENIEFFIPFGFALGAVFAGRKQMDWRKWLMWLGPATVAGFLMTCSIEGSQVMLASRDSCESDIVCNSAGAIIGYGLFGAIGWLVMPWIAMVYVLLRRAVDAQVFAMAAVVWLAAAAAMPFMAGDASSLDDWHTVYRLCAGAETNGTHEFNGRVGCIFMADRAITDDEAARLFDAEDFPAVVGKSSLVAAYRFSGLGPYLDQSRTMAPMEWIGGPPPDLLARQQSPPPAIMRGPWATSFRGVPTSSDHWLRCRDNAAAAVQRIRRNQAFTMMVDFAADLPGSNNISPIATLSAGLGSRNITVIEDQPTLFVRINTPQTGGNGTDPEYQVNDIFGDNSPHRVLVTYQRPVLRIYVDGMSGRFISTLLPETMLINQLYPRQWRYPIGQSSRELIPYVYRILVFVPMGLLIAGATATLRKPRLIAILIGLGVALLLDAELQYFAGAGFSIHRLVATIILCAGVAAATPPPRRWTAPMPLRITRRQNVPIRSR
jgi:glycopeptide antibiotics resistance protein